MFAHRRLLPLSPFRSHAMEIRSLHAPSANRQRRAAVPALALAAWTIALPIFGCYNSVPVATGVTPALGDGTVVLTANGTSAVKLKLGENVREIEGTILRVSPDSLTISVAQTTTILRERFTQNGDTVTIATPNIEQVQKKTLSRKRTTILVGAVVAVIAIALRASTAVSASGGGEGGGGIQP